MDEDATRATHQALGGFLEDDEFVSGWTITVEVSRGDTPYLIHLAGGGLDGTDAPTIWTALGMARANMQWCEDQLRASSEDLEEDD